LESRKLSLPVALGLSQLFGEAGVLVRQEWETLG